MMPLFSQATFFLQKLYVNFGGGISDPTVGGFFSDDSKDAANTLNNLELMVSRLIGSLTALAGIAFLMYFFLGAFYWITAGGDTSKIQKARDQMVQGVIGMIVIIIAYAVVGTIGTILGIDILNLRQQLETIFG